MRPVIGEIVEVRSAAEILATLDSEGKFEGIPFMPEMLAFCGHRFRVIKHADYTCTMGEPRSLANTVHLEHLRCDGSAHRNCQAKCLLFWKEAWLERTALRTGTAEIQGDRLSAGNTSARPATAFLLRSVEQDGGKMMCQATELRSATCVSNLSFTQYVGAVCRDFRVERINARDLRRLLTWTREKLILSAFIWWTRMPWNRSRYHKTPSRALNLMPGEFVKVRPILKILATLDRCGRNRGLGFTPEMFRYCGREFRVLSRLERRISEAGGQIVEFGNDCILLEGVICKGQRNFCSRSEYHYWREIWLERAR